MWINWKSLPSGILLVLTAPNNGGPSFQQHFSDSKNTAILLPSSNVFDMWTPDPIKNIIKSTYSLVYFCLNNVFASSSPLKVSQVKKKPPPCCSSGELAVHFQVRTSSSSSACSCHSRSRSAYSLLASYCSSTYHKW